MGHLRQVGAPVVLLRLLCRRGEDQLRGPRGAWTGVDYGLPQSFKVQALQVGERRTGRGGDAGLAEPPRILLHHHAVSRRRQESALLVHSELPYRVSPGPGSAQDRLQALRQT